MECFFIGIGLSMDAFSLAFAYGMCGLSFFRKVMLSVIVGVFHFFMPLIGLYFGSFLSRYFFIHSNLVVAIIFGVIGIEMMLSVRNDGDIRILNSIFSYFVFGFTVSIDSFTTGIGLSLITDYYYFAVLLFMILSGLFTFLGLFIGSRINYSLGKYSSLFGGIIMVIFAVYYFFNI